MKARAAAWPLLALVALACPPARANDAPSSPPTTTATPTPSPVQFRLLGAADVLFATAPASTDLIDLETSLRLRLDVLHVANRVDFKLDFWGRAGFMGNPSSQELRELSATIHNLGGRVDLTFGRFTTPGGFWLMVDGARVVIRYTDWLSQAFYGGLRSFTTSRDNADLSIDNPVALPLVGTALLVRHRYADAGLTFTYAKDVLNLNNTWQGGQSVPVLPVENEFFLDAHAMLFPLRSLMLAGGGSFGTRYDVQFATSDPLGPAQIGVATLGAVSAWGLAEWRPHDRVRVQYTVNYENIRLIESPLLLTTAAGIPEANPNGAYIDAGLRVVWLAWRSLRLSGQYRGRYRENTDFEHHALVELRGDDLWRGLGGFFNLGLDVIVPGVTNSKRIIYSGGLSYVRRFLDLRAGILFTDGIGSGLLFSQQAPASAGGGSGATPTQLFPFVLEANRVAFLRLFVNSKGWFGGVDVEEDVDLVQLRGLVQVGFSQ